MENKIEDLINDKELLHIRIQKRMEVELQRQKDAGKKFISDEEIDSLIDNIMKEELGDAWKEKY